MTVARGQTEDRANAGSAPAARSASKHVELTERLREIIIAGKIAPGERINEIELSTAFGVSRTPLREALKVLAADGVVELIPNRGAWVPHTTAEDLVESLQVVSVLEGLAGELAAERMTDEEIERVRTLQIAMTSAYEAHDLAGYFRCNQAVHDLILSASGNEALQKAHRAVSGRVLASRYRANLSRERWAAALREHEVILGLLELRQARELGAVLRAHILKKLDALQAQAEVRADAAATPADPPRQTGRRSRAAPD